MHLDLARVDAILDRHPRDESLLVTVLQDVQAEFRYLPCEALDRVAAALSVPRARVFSVATFYRAFDLDPAGRTVVQGCKGTACHVRGAQLLEDELCRELGVGVGATTGDGAFTVQMVHCVGACAMAPVLVVGDRYHVGVKPADIGRILEKASKEARPPISARDSGTVEELSAPFATPADLLPRAGHLASIAKALQRTVRVCGGPGCLAAGARHVRDAILAAAVQGGLRVDVRLEACRDDHRSSMLTLTGCQGLCQQGPLVHVMPQDILYTHVEPSDARDIPQAMLDDTVVGRLLGDAKGRSGHPFYEGQELWALSHCGRVDPESLEEYLAAGGFRALAHAPERMAPDQVIEAVDRRGLRGRGGAGFPTGREWKSALHAAERSGKAPFVLCNGDEDDPGAFMDRAVLEGSPYQVVEGMILGAFALRARQGYVDVRTEYPLAIERMQHAIDRCREAGILGPSVLGSTLSFDLRICRGGGGFVCGESTALMRSIEGKAGEPRAKYIRSVERGLDDSPTVLNNVETWALVPRVVLDGPEAFAAVGTTRSKGTKAFSLTGKVRRTGLVEVPMGTTLRKAVFEVGGGVPEGRPFKAVQTGGPSSGCLPEDKLDLPVDFDALTEAGSVMGSGGMIVMGDTTCMVDVARCFVGLLLEESCGKCAPCRLGMPQTAHLLEGVSQGKATPADLDTIATVGDSMATCSACGLGKSAANPVLSTIRCFCDEYEAHLQGRCPAGVCRDLVRYEITAGCTGCLACFKPCPAHAITGQLEQTHVIDQSRCTRCGVCKSACNVDALRVSSGVLS